MRISSAMIHDHGSGSIVDAQGRLYKLQEQLSTGRRVNAPQDDPIAAASAMRVTDTIARNDQFLINQGAAKNTLAFAEGVVADIGNVLQSVRERLIQGGNIGALTPDDRSTIAQELRAQYDQLLSLANARDSAGNFLFSGGKETTQPFNDAPGGAAVYNGDQSRRTVQVSASRTLAVSENGAELFQRVRTGNGTFLTSATDTNTGTGVISLGSVVDSSALTNDTYRVVFNVVGTTTTYDLVDVTTATTVSAGNAYTSESAIQVAGMQFSIEGAPANGDTFTLQPSPNQSLFVSIEAIAAALESTPDEPDAMARLTTLMGTALGNIDQGIEKALVVRAQFGSGLHELDIMGESSESQQLALKAELSGLVDIDYAKAISDFARTQQALEAARNTYARVMEKSLFDLI